MARTLSDLTSAVREGRPATAASGRLATDHRELFEAIRSELLAQAPLFEDPLAYGAGVLDTLEAVSAVLAHHGQAEAR